MPSIAVSKATRKRLAQLASKEGKTVDEYVQDLLDRTVKRAETAEDIIQKLGLDDISEPAPARRTRKRADTPSKR